ncbi:hypothetical protein [Gordonia aurantiaca]|uniref:hypothetical protein n=1 Tax=Gordonia sp. B21 TaxID=3151852 RepID=UPI003265C04B
MRVLIWVLPLAIYVFFVLGREVLGGDAGWVSVLAIVYSPAVLVALYLPVIVQAFDRDAREARSVRRSFAVTTCSWYLCAAMVTIAIPDGGDSGDWSSPLMSWTGISYSAANALAISALAALAVAVAASLATAVAGVVASRHPGPARANHPAES